MFVTADQLLCHAVGDYVLQSDWMATNKTKQLLPALVHCWLYTCVFVLLGATFTAFLCIFLAHFFIDYYRLARYVIWLKNQIAPTAVTKPWRECSLTGFPSDRPEWLTVWLLIIVDNTMHVVCNALALKYL